MDKFRFKILLCILLTVLLSGCAKADDRTPSASGQQAEDAETSGQQDVPKEQDVSVPGIEFEAKDIEGNTVTSAVFSESRLTMVNVWATYCNPCLSEMPGLGELAGEYDSDEFQLIGIISDVMEGADQETTEQAAALISQTGAAYPHLLLNESLYFGLLQNVSAVPTTFFVNEKGEILDMVVGAMKKEAWEEKVNELLEEN